MNGCFSYCPFVLHAAAVPAQDRRGQQIPLAMVFIHHVRENFWATATDFCPSSPRCCINRTGSPHTKRVVSGDVSGQIHAVGMLNVLDSLASVEGSCVHTGLYRFRIMLQHHFLSGSWQICHLPSRMTMYISHIRWNEELTWPYLVWGKKKLQLSSVERKLQSGQSAWSLQQKTQASGGEHACASLVHERNMWCCLLPWQISECIEEGFFFF